MLALILLDVDGVLNPRVVSDRKRHGHRLVLEPERAQLVRRLAEAGTIVWATTWPPRLTSVLARDLQLPPSTEAITFEGGLPRDPRFPGHTGKLQPVASWLEQTRSAGALVDAIVWIDDNLRVDAFDWADAQDIPVHVVVPDPAAGLTSDQVTEVEDFLRAISSR